MITQKDFKAVAEIIRDSHHYDSCGQQMSNVCFKRAAKRFADYFATQNQRFDRNRFMKASGLD